MNLTSSKVGKGLFSSQRVIKAFSVGAACIIDCVYDIHAERENFMEEKKTSFVLPTDCLEDLADFSYAEAGELFNAILRYVDGQGEPELEDRAMKMFFRRVKRYIDSSKANYDKKVQANRINGAKGGRPRKENSENPTHSDKTDRFSEKPYTESETEYRSESESMSKSVSASENESEPDGSGARTHTKKYGENKNVELTEEEFELLAEQMGVGKRDEYIENLGNYMASTGKTYLSHYATIRSWFSRDGGKKSTASYDIGEFIARGERLPVYESKTDSS